MDALLSSRGRKAALARPCTTDLVTAYAVRVRLPSSLAAEGRTPAARIARLGKVLGRDLHLRIMDDNRDVWEGPVRITNLEDPQDTSDVVLVTLAYETPLETEDLQRLGLLAPTETVDSVRRPRAGPAAGATQGIVSPERDAPAQNLRAPAAANRRRAERLPAHVPVAVHVRRGPVRAEVRDLSRTGLRFRLQISDFDLEPAPDLRTVSTAVAEVLTGRFQVDIHHEMLGSLLRKRVVMTRLGTPRDEADWVEISGRFEEPLSLEETTVLGLPLPPEEGSDEAWDPSAPMQKPVRRSATTPRGAPEVDDPDVAPREARADPTPALPRGASRDPLLGLTVPNWCAALVRRSTDDGEAPVACHADRVGRGGVRVRLGRRETVLGRAVHETDIARLAARLGEIFGGTPRIQLMDGKQHLWTGPARMCAIQVPPDDSNDLWVSFQFLEPPSPAAVRVLGLPPAA